MADRHVLGISGGKDSAALAIFMSQEFPHLDIDYFFTDTGKELPEVYDFLGKLEGLLDKPILKLNPKRDFDFWLNEYGNFLPSAQTRWCTRQLKLAPFRKWVDEALRAGDKVTSYVAIRADEDYREGYASTHPNLRIAHPFREYGIDKEGVYEILKRSGVGLPKYYEWRARSGCTFCFYQQKIEWVGLMERHPDAFEDAKTYEKSAIESGSPFSWTDGESLEELSRPERVQAIKFDFLERKKRAEEEKKRNANPLREGLDLNIDDIYGDDENRGSCNVCHK